MKIYICIRFTMCFLFLFTLSCSKDSTDSKPAPAQQPPASKLSEELGRLSAESQRKLRELQESPKPAFDATPLVNRLFRALRENDFDTIYEGDYEMQLEAQRIRQEGPQFLADKKVKEAKETAKQLFDSENSNYREILNVACLNPDTEITEIRKGFNQERGITYYEVYVTLKFKSIEAAPFRSEFENGTMDKELKAIKQTVVNLAFSDSGYYSTGKRIYDVDTTFAELPFKILSMEIRPEFFVYIKIIGGKPPYTSKTELSGFELEKPSGVKQNGHTISMGRLDHNRYVNGTKLGTSQPLSGSISVTDSSGKQDAVTFVLPSFDSGKIFKFLRVPWSENELYKRVGLSDFEGALQLKDKPANGSGP